LGSLGKGAPSSSDPFLFFNRARTLECVLKIVNFVIAFNLSNMQRLVIPVNESVAAAWQEAGPEQRARIVTLFCWLVEKEEWKNFTPATFSKLLDEVSAKAEANGLTPEILDEILHGS
jgi:hypothetical protein